MTPITLVLSSVYSYPDLIPNSYFMDSIKYEFGYLSKCFDKFRYRANNTILNKYIIEKDIQATIDGLDSIIDSINGIYPIYNKRKNKLNKI